MTIDNSASWNDEDELADPPPHPATQHLQGHLHLLLAPPPPPPPSEILQLHSTAAASASASAPASSSSSSSSSTCASALPSAASLLSSLRSRPFYTRIRKLTLQCNRHESMCWLTRGEALSAVEELELYVMDEKNSVDQYFFPLNTFLVLTSQLPNLTQLKSMDLRELESHSQPVSIFRSSYSNSLRWPKLTQLQLSDVNVYPAPALRAGIEAASATASASASASLSLSLDAFPQLTSLYLGSPLLTDQQLEQLCASAAANPDQPLKELKLSMTNLLTPQGFSSIARHCSHMIHTLELGICEHLDLHSILPTLLSLKNQLQTLHFGASAESKLKEALNEADFVCLSQLTQLRNLDIFCYESQPSDALSVAAFRTVFSSLPHLTYLDLSFPFDDARLMELRACQQLRWVKLNTKSWTEETRVLFHNFTLETICFGAYDWREFFAVAADSDEAEARQLGQVTGDGEGEGESEALESGTEAEAAVAAAAAEQQRIGVLDAQRWISSRELMFRKLAANLEAQAAALKAAAAAEDCVARRTRSRDSKKKQEGEKEQSGKRARHK